MRSLLIAITLVLTVISGAQAIEPVNEHQLMLYYEVPFGSNSRAGDNHSFGLRLDQTSHAPREVVTLDHLKDKTAVLDFRAGQRGVESFKVHGVDYANRLFVARAATEEGAEDTGAAETTAEDEGAAADTTEPVEKEEKTEFEKKLAEVPIGVVIGGLLFIGILAGAGD